MRTVTQLKEDIAIHVKKLGDMKATCIADNRDPDEEERGRAAEYMIEESMEMFEKHPERFTKFGGEDDDGR